MQSAHVWFSVLKEGGFVYCLWQFPFFCKDREYVIGRRIWSLRDAYFCITKVTVYHKSVDLCLCLCLYIIIDSKSVSECSILYDAPMKRLGEKRLLAILHPFFLPPSQDRYETSL